MTPERENAGENKGDIFVRFESSDPITNFKFRQLEAYARLVQQLMNFRKDEISIPTANRIKVELKLLRQLNDAIYSRDKLEFHSEITKEEHDININQMFEELWAIAEFEEPKTSYPLPILKDASTIDRTLHDIKNAHMVLEGFLGLFVINEASSDELMDVLKNRTQYIFNKSAEAYQIVSEAPPVPRFREVFIDELYELVEKEFNLFKLAQANSELYSLVLKQKHFFDKNRNRKVAIDPSHIEGYVANVFANARDAYDSIGTQIPRVMVISFAFILPKEAESQKRYRLHTGSAPHDKDVFVALVIDDHATGYSPDRIQRGLEEGGSSKPKGWGVGLYGYKKLFSEYPPDKTIEIIIDNHKYDARDPSRIGARTIAKIRLLN